MLAVVNGYIKFHNYNYGVPNVIVERDHKPVECIIIKKPSCQATILKSHHCVALVLS